MSFLRSVCGMGHGLHYTAYASLGRRYSTNLTDVTFAEVGGFIPKVDQPRIFSLLRRSGVKKFEVKWEDVKNISPIPQDFSVVINDLSQLSSLCKRSVKQITLHPDMISETAAKKLFAVACDNSISTRIVLNGNDKSCAETASSYWNEETCEIVLAESPVPKKTKVKDIKKALEEGIKSELHEASAKCLEKGIASEDISLRFHGLTRIHHSIQEAVKQGITSFDYRLSCDTPFPWGGRTIPHDDLLSALRDECVKDEIEPSNIRKASYIAASTLSLQLNPYLL